MSLCNVSSISAAERSHRETRKVGNFILMARMSSGRLQSAKSVKPSRIWPEYNERSNSVELRRTKLGFPYEAVIASA
jgi:hypothetical protein